LNYDKPSISGDFGMKLVGYIRVSTQEQADNTSLADQRKKIKSYCVAMGHELVEVFEEVGSGKNTTDRPLFTQALEAVRYRADVSPPSSIEWPGTPGMYWSWWKMSCSLRARL
jgi:Resolvase, N terminal domain